eukprot:2526796-Rhodomonas_salina.1
MEQVFLDLACACDACCESATPVGATGLAPSQPSTPITVTVAITNVCPLFARDRDRTGSGALSM